jgi:hypothetical protein
MRSCALARATLATPTWMPWLIALLLSSVNLAVKLVQFVVNRFSLSSQHLGSAITKLTLLLKKASHKDKEKNGGKGVVEGINE